ncbi:MAG: acyl-CoA thioesterase [Ignavibacteria bacterium]|nr:acyl-CoA thioesterase [Ignavibacteria bacterium]
MSNYSIFETEIIVRPSDLDINQHVHYSKYLDYLLLARYDQMKRCYKVSMEDFVAFGYSWVASTVNINYKREVKMQDVVIAKTQVDSYAGAQIKVNFWFVKKETNKVAAEGWAVYTLISLKNGRPTRIPDDLIQKYLI